MLSGVKMSIKDEILRSVVIHYISDETPIGSVQLQKEYNLEISSATIRNHFKRLVVEGMLEQLHSSSGRIPTNDALIAFWIDEIKSNQKLHIESLKRLAQASASFGIFASLHDESANRLVKTEVYGGHSIVAELEEGVVVLPYSKALDRFLGEFGGSDISDLVRISKEVGVHELTRALLDFIREHRLMKFNQEALIEIGYKNRRWAENYFDSYYSGDIAFWLQNGVNIDHTVPHNCIVGKQSCLCEGREYTLTYLGESSRDYRRFLSLLQGG